MQVGFQVIKNYKTAVQYILKTNKNYEKSISKNLTYAMENIANNKNKPLFDDILNRIYKAPEPLLQKLTSLKHPSNLSELQTLRKEIKVICRKNPEAKDFMNGLKEYLIKTPEVKRLTKSVGKTTENFINVFFMTKKSQNPFMRKNISQYLSSAEQLFTNVRKTGLNEHLQKFFEYVTKG